MISKELLSEVINRKCIKILDIDNENSLNYMLPEQIVIEYVEKNIIHRINIYELSNKCKVWAFNKGYALYIKIRPDILDLKDVDHFYVVQIGTGSDKTARQFHADSEPEAIFEACSYIMDNLKDKD